MMQTALWASSHKFTCAGTWEEIRVKGQVGPWWKLVWSEINIRRNSFIGWLTMRNNLPNKERMIKWGYNDNSLRVLICNLAWWATVYHIWQQRNDVIHSSRIRSDKQIVKDIMRDVKGILESKLQSQ